MLKLETQYSNVQIDKIRDQGAIYICACPSQVSMQIAYLRKLFEYQQQCVARDEGYIDSQTHCLIARYTAEAHALLEQCLTEILHIEGWNLETLDMPANLRALMLKIAQED